MQKTYETWRSVMFLPCVVAIAVSSVACANSGGQGSANILAPSATSGAIVVGAEGKGGGGKPGGGGTSGGSSSLTLVLYTDVNGNGLVNYGDTVTFNVSTTATTKPEVGLQCFQNGTLVFTAYTAYYPGYPWPWTQHMTLSSMAWTGGAASCTATLYSETNPNLGTLNFNVGA